MEICRLKTRRLLVGDRTTFLMRKILVRLRAVWVEWVRMPVKETRRYHSQPRRRGKGPNKSKSTMPPC